MAAITPILSISRPDGLVVANHAAMATEFSFWLGGHEPQYLRAAAQEAFACIDSIEAKLSLYREGSDVSRINLAHPGDELRVSEETLQCLLLARDASALTDGAFNVFMGAPSLANKHTSADLPIHVIHALEMIETQNPAPVLELVPDSYFVRKSSVSGLLDFGALGKGFALDEVAKCLREWDVSIGCLIAGGSSILILDPPEGEEGFKWGLGIAKMNSVIDDPRPLCRIALGASGLGFQASHIIDPFNPKMPALRRQALAFTQHAAWADALSTAAMILPEECLETIADKLSPCGFLIPSIQDEKQHWRFFGRGLNLSAR